MADPSSSLTPAIPPASAPASAPALATPLPPGAAWTLPIEAPLVRRLRPLVARRLLAAAVGLGVAFQALFVGQLAGLNVPVWVAGVLLVIVLLAPRPWRIRRSDAWLPVAALAFASLVALRASPSLVAFDLMAASLLTALSLAAWAGAAVTSHSLSGIGALVGQGMALGSVGAVRLGAAPRGLRAAGAMGGRGRAVLVGLALALPLVVASTLLFASADAVFERLLRDLGGVSVDLGDVPGRALVAAGATWVVGGLLVLLVAATQRVRREPAPLGARLGAIEATVVLLAVDVVFAAFVVIQAGYLFGGMDTVDATGLGYAQYARRGFFELVAVAALAGAVILAGESLVADRVRAYRASALVLIALTGAVLLSAGVRMALYQDAFGWSELRFFVVAAIVWLAACLVAAAVGLAMGRSRSLPAAVAVLALVVAFGVNLADPGAFIAQQNLARAMAPASVPPGGTSVLDADHLVGLGPDAVPTIVRALPTLPPDDRVRLELALARNLHRLTAGADAGWPSWNLARSRAADALAAPPGT